MHEASVVTNSFGQIYPHFLIQPVLFSFDYYFEIMIFQKQCSKTDAFSYNGITEKYVAHMEPRYGAVDREFDKLSLEQENGFLWDDVNPESSELPGDGLPKERASEVGISDVYGS